MTKKQEAILLICILSIFTIGILIGITMGYNKAIRDTYTIESNDIAATITNTTGHEMVAKECYRVYQGNDVDCNESCILPREV